MIRTIAFIRLLALYFLLFCSGMYFMTWGIDNKDNGINLFLIAFITSIWSSFLICTSGYTAKILVTGKVNE